MQGNPLSPTVFNVVVDAVVRHWIDGIVDEDEEKGETGREGRHQSEVFYANDGMVVLSDPAWLQGDFSALVAIFDRVGLRTNFGKTVSMACHPCRAGAGNRTEAAYSWRLTRLGKTYTERQREIVACGKCGTVIAVGYMSSHLMTRHGKAATRRHLWAPQTNGGPRTYKMHFLAKGGRRQCLVERCPGVVGNTSDNAGALCAPALPRHHGDTGGGQPPPTTVPLVRPPGLQEGAQRAPPGYQLEQDGDGA